LYRKLADHLGVEPSSVVLTAGSDGGIRAVFEAFVSPEDVVVHTEPTYAMYPVYARMFGARTTTLRYERRGTELTLDVSGLRDIIRAARPRVVCIPNPDSPAGTVLQPAELRALVDEAAEFSCVVLVDEAYHPFYDRTALGWVSSCPNLVVARSCAKAWALAGLRIGYAVADPALARLLQKVRPNYEVNGFAAAVMERLLDHTDDMRASVARLNEGRDLFCDAMERLGLPVIRARGNFAHVAFGTAAPAVHAALADLVVYKHDFEMPPLNGFSRFSATTSDRIQPVIQRIAELFPHVR
jgi:histidinol-phosphate aminotransferase